MYSIFLITIRITYEELCIKFSNNLIIDTSKKNFSKIENFSGL
ncbi:hypothetical protein FWK35_00005310 [Aphis craccivora]|uniref:Uncharacterized protein n=1 Tax=Aphis craccivora TaxID=307492 RepID=A0A6G0Z171_APHCR|nr:hypothetical protein FWK35_00005310 [Aphis craccivora]